MNMKASRKKIRVLTIVEPWATLIKERKKFIETRGWYTPYRGEIYIHAGARRIDFSPAFVQNVLKLIPNVPLNYGKIICKANLVDCVKMDSKFISKIKENNQEYICGIYEPGRYAWVFENIEVLEQPIYTKGDRGIWEKTITIFQ